MSTVEHFDAVILGGGKAGKTLAMDLARGGQRVAMIERGMIGGSCINVACIPTKTLVRSAKAAELSRRMKEFGVNAGRSFVSMEDVRRRTRSVVEGMVGLNQAQFEASGMEFILGEGRFLGPKTVEVRLLSGGSRQLTGERIFINTGTRSGLPEVPGLAATGPLTHVTALELERLPSHLVVLGGGVIGVELGQAFRRLGARVTVIERGPQLLPREDPDVAEAVSGVFHDEGIEVRLDTPVLDAEGRSGDRVKLRLQNRNGSEAILEATDILVATGRTPNTDGLGLDNAGVVVDERGFIKVNERLETSAPGIWALGDVAGSPQFTHVSLDDYRVVRSNLPGGSSPGKPRTTLNRLIPYAVFIDPELGRVGLGEEEAQRHGTPVRVAKLPMAAVPRARTIGETRGFMKAVVDGTSDRLLGFVMLGAEAGEVTTVVQMAMLGGLPFTALRDAIIAHPTMAEGLNLLFSKIPPIPVKVDPLA